ncbi:MAG: M23 family metallopeptidase [Sphingomonadales bacterium]
MRVAGPLLGAILFVAPLAAVAGSVVLDGPLTQGGLVIGHAPAGTSIKLDGISVRVSDSGLFVFGFGRDAERRASLEIVYSDGTSEHRTLNVRRRSYRVERIDGLPPKMVTPPKQVLERIRRENARIAEVRARDTDIRWFADGFRWPTRGPITGVYGSQRILNGKPRRPHFGLDIAPPAGAAVVAPAGGIVAMAESDLYYTGGTVMIDHGHGVVSVFSHLQSLDVATGTVVKPGQRIGAVGATGRATGPHLDWRVNWFSKRLDPALLLDGVAGSGP